MGDTINVDSQKFVNIDGKREDLWILGFFLLSLWLQFRDGIWRWQRVPYVKRRIQTELV